MSDPPAQAPDPDAPSDGSEDEFDRGLRDLQASPGRKSRFTEPSAAQRARKPVGDVRRRESRKARKLREPVRAAGKGRPRSAPGRQGRGGRREPGAGSSGSARRWAGAAVVIVVVLLGTLWLGRARFGLPGTFAGLGAPASGSPSAPMPGALPRPAFLASDPFAGTPAERWPANAAGIAPPAAHAAGRYPAGQVAAAYAATRRLLIAGNLDPATLRGGRPAAFAGLLAPQERSYFLHNLDRAGTNRHGFTRSSRAWLTSFAPDSTESVGSVVKVHGFMTAKSVVTSGRRVLRIHFNYLFVYPVQRPGQPLTRMRVVAHQFGDADFAQWDDPGGPLQAWWLPGNGSGAGPSRCDIRDGFVHPLFPASAPDTTRPSGSPVNPYDLTGQPPAGCRGFAGT